MSVWGLAFYHYEIISYILQQELPTDVKRGDFAWLIAFFKEIMAE